jgi:sigma-B regulation protein RsbU (phosphoserine phosphatase)
VWDSIIKVLSGPLLAKLGMAAVLIAAFLFLRKKDTEGAMTGYALLSGFLALRDLVFAFLPLSALYGASDLILLGFILYLALKPFSLGWPFWVVAGLDLAAVAAIALQALGLDLGVPAQYLRLVALLPALALALVPLLFRDETDSNARMLSHRSWLPLLAGTAVYILAGTFLGAGQPLFSALTEMLVYGLLFALALGFVDILQGQLISAVDYYEESVDSLYDLLLSTGTAMRSDSFLQDVVDNMIRTVVARTGADGGVLLLADEFEETVSVRALCGSYPPPFKLPENLPKAADRVESFVRHARFKLGEGILGEVSRTGKHVFVPQAGPDSPLPDNGEESWLKAGGFIASPLIVRDRIIGAVSVVKSGEGSFSERDFDRCKLLANFGSIAVANSFSFLEAAERSDIEREADIAATVQSNLAPKRLPDVGGLSFGIFASSARGVCSDYYDIIPTRPDKAVIAVGDVAGKGVAASIVLVMLRSILQLITASTKDVATLLQWVNRGITGKVDLDHYATLCLAAVDAGSGAIELANAGHQPALVCRASDGTLEAVEAKSVPIGVERGTAYTSTRIALGEGDLLVLYTDGIVETMNPQGKQYGRKNLGAVLQKARALSPRKIAEMIEEDLLGFAGQTRPHDDRTVLVVKRSKA